MIRVAERKARYDHYAKPIHFKSPKVWGEKDWDS